MKQKNLKQPSVVNQDILLDYGTNSAFKPLTAAYVDVVQLASPCPPTHPLHKKVLSSDFACWDAHSPIKSWQYIYGIRTIHLGRS